MAEKKISFEEALATLDEVLAALNAGDIPLEEAINQYKKGLDMAKICQEKLEAVEGELKILEGNIEKPFQIKEEI